MKNIQRKNGTQPSRAKKPMVATTKTQLMACGFVKSGFPEK